MASFTVRMELHGANDDDYETLHREMTEQGFETTIKGSSGKRYELPKAEYSYRGIGSVARVKRRALAAAKKTDRRAAILVTEVKGHRSWAGLQEAPKTSYT